MAIEPVPFTIAQAGEDTVSLDGARSVTYRASGTLRLEARGLQFEWTLARHLEQVSLISVEIDDAELPPERLELPTDRIADARVTGGWWAPRLILYARWANAFDTVPGAGRGRLVLRIARRDRPAARAMATALRSPLPLEGVATPPQLPT